MMPMIVDFPILSFVKSTTLQPFYNLLSVSISMVNIKHIFTLLILFYYLFILYYANVFNVELNVLKISTVIKKKKTYNSDNGRYQKNFKY